MFDNYDKKAVEKGVSIIEEIRRLVEEYADLMQSLKRENKNREINLIGGIIIGTYCPLSDKATFAFESGMAVIREGLEQRIQKELVNLNKVGKNK